MGKKSGFSLLEKFSIICIIFASSYLIYLYLMPVMDVLSSEEFNPQDFLLNLIILLIGLCAFFGGLTLAKKVIAMDQLIDMGFENGIYNRLEPILQEIAASQVVFNKMDERLNNMNMNVDRLGKRSVELKISGSDSDSAFGIDIVSQISRFLRLTILINISLVTLIFLLNFTRSYTPLILTMLFVIWWLEITYEFKLWERSSIYWWGFIPILTIPITTILGDIMYGSGVLIGSMGIALVVYATAYYSWCKYIVEGILPFDLNVPMSKVSTDENMLSKISSKAFLMKIDHLNVGKWLVRVSTILALFLILQLFSVNIYPLGFLPTFSFDQFILLGILSVIFYTLGIKLKHKGIDKEIETL